MEIWVNPSKQQCEKKMNKNVKEKVDDGNNDVKNDSTIFGHNFKTGIKNWMNKQTNIKEENALMPHLDFGELFATKCVNINEKRTRSLMNAK